MKRNITCLTSPMLLLSILLAGNPGAAQSVSPVTSVPLPAESGDTRSQPADMTVRVPATPTPAEGQNGSSQNMQFTPNNREPQNPASLKMSMRDLKIGPGDLLDVVVFGIGDFNQTTRVSESGDIILPLIGQVHVANFTSQQAQNLVAEKLVKQNFYKHPQVTVFIKEYATQGVSVLGEVNKPGVYPRLGDHRLFDMISAAGGYTQKAGTTVTITHREEPDKPHTVTLSNDPVKNYATNIEIFPGDTIVVSQAGIVYVVGDVSKPSGFAMQNNENMSVLQALAMAGGANPTAKLDNARLIRKNTSGMQEFPVPLKKMLEAKANDQALQPGDVLFVPTSSGKNAAKRGLEAILQTATGLAIYHPW